MHDSPKPLLDHLTELRRRLIISFGCFFVFFVGCYSVSEYIFGILVHPLSQIFLENGLERRLIYTNLTEAFTTYLKVGAFGAAFLSFPVFAMQIWKFIAPGLYKNERRFFTPLMIATPLLFILGALFAYFYVFPTAYKFFLSFETPGVNGNLPIQLEAKLNEYLSFAMRLIMAFGICFELPVILTLLATTGVVTSSMLKNKWRIAVVLIFAAAAFITPPDIFSMVALAIPLILLYVVSIVLVKCVEKPNNKDIETDTDMDFPVSVGDI